MEHFPTLIKYNKCIFCENAGGTQITKYVSDRITHYLHNMNVQIDGTYNIAYNANVELQNARFFIDTLLNNKIGTIEFGLSTTQLAFNVAKSLPNNLFDDVILSEMLHASMTTSFERESKNTSWWTFEQTYDDLLDMITEKTTMVVLPHVSNITGCIFDIAYLSQQIKKLNKNVIIIVDGVAYLPHRIVDVDGYDVDFYFVSFYKFFGPHIAAVYIKNVNNLLSINHSFIDDKKLELGTIPNELIYGLLGIDDYIKKVLKITNNVRLSRHNIKHFYDIVTQIENKLVQHFDDNKSKFSNLFKVVTNYKYERIPIFSLSFCKYPSEYITVLLNEFNILCKMGKFHSVHFLSDNVVRLSFVHYNTITELDYIVDLFTELNKSNKTEWFFGYLFGLYKNNYITLTNITISSNFQKRFDNLSKDVYYDSNRFRLYSLVNTSTYEIIGNNRFIQSRYYNKTERGNQIRHYQPINIILEHEFNTIIKMFCDIVKHKSDMDVRYVTVHQMRVDAKNTISPVPEGIHQDGYEYIGILCVKRQNVEGGQTIIYDSSMNIIYSKLLEEGNMVVLNDQHVYHNVTNIKAVDSSMPSYRDVIVITTVF